MTMLRRLTGVVLVFAFLLLYEPASDHVVDRAILPLMLGVGAWLVLRNTLALALAVALLAGIHATPGEGDVYRSLVYPWLAAAATLLALGILTLRLRRQMRATHVLRWHARRSTRSDPSQTDDQPE